MVSHLFEMVPGWVTLPMVLLATAATVIASQATITGAFSITRQAIQMQLLPRLDILHTSETQSGQIYMPQVNFILLAGVLVLVLGFGSSGGLAAAYGIAVTGVMLVTAALLFAVIWRCWNRPAFLADAVVAPFFLLDGTFLWANLQKVTEGGWVSVVVAVAILVVMWTWIKGSRIPRALAVCRRRGWKFDIMTTSFFLSRRSLKQSARSQMRHGRTSCSGGSPATPPTQASIFRSRQDVRSRSGRKGRSSALRTNLA